MCVLEKNDLSCMSQGPRFSSITISGVLSIAIKKKQQNKLQKNLNFPRGGKKLAACEPGVAFATPWLQV